MSRHLPMKDYKPPPSAPAGTRGQRNRVKMFTSLQPRPYKLVGDPSLLPPSSQAQPTPSHLQEIMCADSSPKQTRLSSQRGISSQRARGSSNQGGAALNAGLNSIHRNDPALRSKVHVPDQKLGSHRTRIFIAGAQSEDNMGQILQANRKDVNNFI